MPDIEIQTGPSKAEPGKTNVVIIGPDPASVQTAIQDLIDGRGNCSAQFTLPARCADHRWAVMGRIW